MSFDTAALILYNRHFLCMEFANAEFDLILNDMKFNQIIKSNSFFVIIYANMISILYKQSQKTSCDTL